MMKFNFLMPLDFLTAKLLLMMILTLFFFFSLTNLHPIMMIIGLIIYSMLICLNMSIWKKNYMYSIMIFLIMISGLLIMFMYFASLISNERIYISLNYTMFSLISFNSIWFCLMIHKNDMIYFNFLKNISKTLINLNNIHNSEFMNIMTMYKFPFNNIIIICMFYLLFTLFIIIKMCSFMSISLRKIN